MNQRKFSDFLMIYIIDDQITYNSDDCTLNHISTQEVLNLSISSGRLFEQLLNSNGEILARDTLLIEVWDKYGLRGSNSNLNQYLSILRRALAAYGCENLIITVPKTGIRLNTEIKIERESHSFPERNILAEPSKDSVLPQAFASEQSVKNHFPGFKYALLTIFTLVLLGGTVWYFTKNDSAEQHMPMSTVKLKGGCEAIIIQGLDVFEKQSVEKRMLEILRDNNQSCEPGRRLYFDKNTSFTNTNYGRTLLSACNLSNSGHVISCDNFYYLDWRMN